MTGHNDTDATARPWRVEEGTTLIWGACNPDDLSSYGMGYPVAQACLSHGWNQRHDLTIDQAMANAAIIVEAVNAYEPLKARLAEVERERDEARAALGRIAQPDDLAADPSNFGAFAEAYLNFAQYIARTALAAEQKEAGK